jgi:hypothetical protein
MFNVLLVGGRPPALGDGLHRILSAAYQALDL